MFSLDPQIGPGHRCGGFSMGTPQPRRSLLPGTRPSWGPTLCVSSDCDPPHPGKGHLAGARVTCEAPPSPTDERKSASHGFRMPWAAASGDKVLGCPEPGAGLPSLVQSFPPCPWLSHPTPPPNSTSQCHGTEHHPSEPQESPFQMARPTSTDVDHHGNNLRAVRQEGGAPEPQSFSFVPCVQHGAGTPRASARRTNEVTLLLGFEG